VTRIFHRDPKTSMPVAVGGEGVHLIDAEGRRYLDASGGAAVSCLGHGHPEVTAALRDQAGRLAYAHTSFFTTEPAERLADFLVETAPPGIGWVYYVSGGSEAMEAALKLARQFHVDNGEPQRVHFIARRQSYHGNTLGALAVGGNAWRRAPFAPLLVDVAHVSPCYAYRGQTPGETEEEYAGRLAAELEAEILRLGPGRVAGFVAETVVGATLGAVPPVAGYFRRVRDVCDRHGVLLILDEVMCGMGRTGTLHACEQEGIAPDLMTVAKGLGGGYQPIGAVLVAERIYRTVLDGTGYFQHGHTYLAHPVACAAALAVQTVIRRDGLLETVARRGRGLYERLRDRFANHPHVGDIRGRGLFQGIELVRDRATREPFDPGLRLHARIKRQAMARGLLVYPMGGTVDGRSGDHVLLAPPFIVSEDDLDAVADRLAAAVDAALLDVAG
jgi:adenosylmethionine-8-amino-7-oxononanoate aminotransferase